MDLAATLFFFVYTSFENKEGSARDCEPVVPGGAVEPEKAISLARKTDASLEVTRP